MKIENPALLAEFRTPGKCAWCGKKCRVREPAHLWAKGFGGGGQLDVRVNLIALGSTLAFECSCHTDHHAGNRPLFCDLLALVAQREGLQQQEISDTIAFLRRVPNRATATAVRKALAELDPVPRALARKILEEVKETVPAAWAWHQEMIHEPEWN